MEDKEPEEKKGEAEEDEELSALLESAEKDFDALNIADAKGKSKEKEGDEKTESSAVRPTPPEKLWTDEFLEQHLSSFFAPGADGQLNMEQLGEEINRLAEASTQAAGFDASTPDSEFASIFAQTLRDLSQGADNIPNEENLMNMLGSLGNLDEGGNGDPGDLLPFMQKMMQNLLSKDILYPAISSIAEKYPAWIEENKATLSEENLMNYQMQYTKMQTLCTELDGETAADTDEVKKARFDKILVLMQEIQGCGQPPAELVGADMEGDERLQLPPGLSPDQCSLQ